MWFCPQAPWCYLFEVGIGLISTAFPRQGHCFLKCLPQTKYFFFFFNQIQLLAVLFSGREVHINYQVFSLGFLNLGPWPGNKQASLKNKRGQSVKGVVKLLNSGELKKMLIMIRVTH